MFDISLGTLAEDQPGRFGVSGGPYLDLPTTSPSLGAIFTINGNPIYIGGNFIGSLAGPGPGSLSLPSNVGTQFFTYTFNVQNLNDLQNTTVNAADVLLFNFDGMLPSSFGTPFSYTLTATDLAQGSVGIGLPSSGPAGPLSDCIVWPSFPLSSPFPAPSSAQDFPA